MALILLGRITHAHGIKGAVKLQSYTANPPDIARYGPLQTAAGRIIEIKRLKPAGDGFIADLAGVADRNAAEALKGTELFIPRERLPTLGRGEFYLVDLVGMTVKAEKQALGVVCSIDNYGAGDLMKLDSGELVPVAFVTDVADVIAVDLPPGYLDPATREDKQH